VVELADGASFRNIFNTSNLKAAVPGLGELSGHRSLLVGPDVVQTSECARDRT